MMMLNRAPAALAVLLLVGAVAQFSEAADPSEGWLSYAAFKAQPTQTSERAHAQTAPCTLAPPPAVYSTQPCPAQLIGLTRHAFAPVTRLSAKMVVPESPKAPGSSPAFWFGVQTAKGDGALVQPIMAKELGYRPGSGSSFFMFQGKPCIHVPGTCCLH
jgi:hypothetical protein